MWLLLARKELLSQVEAFNYLEVSSMNKMSFCCGSNYSDASVVVEKKLNQMVKLLINESLCVPTLIPHSYYHRVYMQSIFREKAHYSVFLPRNTADNRPTFWILNFVPLSLWRVVKTLCSQSIREQKSDPGRSFSFCHI